MKNVTRTVLLVLLVVTLVTMVFGIGTIPLRDPYEAAYGEVAREMAQSGNYVSPRLFDRFLPGMPPLGFLFSAFCIQVFGATEFAVRLPSALLLTLLTVLLYVAVTHTFNERAGFWSGMAFGTSLLTFYLVKTSVTDTFLVFFVTVALLCFIRGHYWLLYVTSALLVLSDGPVALVFPAAIILLYLLLTGRIYLLGRMHVFRGILLVVILCAPWIAFEVYAHGLESLPAFFSFHYFGVPFQSTQSATQPLWFYLPVLLAGTFPWTGVAIKSLKDTICESRTSDLEILLLFHIWWIFVFLFFTFAGARILTSLLLAIPPLSVLVGWNLDRMPRENRGHYGGWAFVSLVMFAVAAFVWIYCFRDVPLLSFASLVLSAITALCGIGVGIALLGYRDAALGKWLHAAAGILSMFVVYSFFLPVLQDSYSVRSLTQQYISASRDSHAALYVEHDYHPGVSFYAQRLGRELDPKNADTISDLWRDKGPKFVLLSRRSYDQLKGTIGGEDWRLEGEKQGVCLFSYTPPVVVVTETPKPAAGKPSAATSAAPGPASPAAEQVPQEGTTSRPKPASPVAEARDRQPQPPRP
ncbi:MAG: ArnT family glycosyltransferase [Succiniclasticum sp.]|jgi:4-amino-4-deoxy-L-arabinose transferase-like glycosyltransferase